MDPTAVVLLHSPLTTVTAWGRLPSVLREAGSDEILVVDVREDDSPPFATRYVADAARQIVAAAGTDPVLLVAHSGAGPLLPQLAFARRAGHGHVAGYVFLDASLPRPGGTASRLDLLAAEDAETAEQLGAELDAGGRFPAWTDADLAEDVPDAADRAQLLAALRPRTTAFFTEPVPFPGDWPDAPCGFLRTSAAYDGAARLAAGRGWPVESIDGGHFAAFTEPEQTAQALLSLVARM